MERDTNIDVILRDAEDMVLLADVRVGTSSFFSADTGESHGSCVMLQLTPLEGEVMMVALPSKLLLSFSLNLVASVYGAFSPIGQAKFLCGLMAAIEPETRDEASDE